jgi:glycosyltransferase involved in cell wall biosynthesis
LSRILWIPHQQLSGSNQARCEYLIRHLPQHEHRILHWQKPRWRLADLRTLVRGYRHEHDQRFVFIRLLAVTRMFWWLWFRISGSASAYARYWLGYTFYNNFLLNRAIKTMARDWPPDSMVFTHNAVGRISLSSLNASQSVFDYVDLPYEQMPVIESVINQYIDDSDHVTCVSTDLIKLASKRRNQHVHYLPNGLDRSRLTRRTRSELGNPAVISIIGLTCSDRYYFIDAIKQLIDEHYPVSGLIVGSGQHLEPLRAKISGYESHFEITGFVEHKAIDAYFQKTDIGLYPVDATAYYTAASPIKCFEYSYASCFQIVSPHLPEVDGYNLPNIRFCDDNQAALVTMIKQVLASTPEPISEQDFDQYDWVKRAEMLADIMTLPQSGL